MSTPPKNPCSSEKSDPPPAYETSVFCREKTDPFGVENLDSNNVLEAEIEAIAPKAATGDLASVMRKGALETKLLVRGGGRMP